MNEKRFVKFHNLGGTCFIKDNRNETLVCIILPQGRPANQTDAMCDVMLNALNAAVENKKHGETHE